MHRKGRLSAKEGINKKTPREKEVRKPGRPPDNTATEKHEVFTCGCS
jgi:hypothetical protein